MISVRKILPVLLAVGLVSAANYTVHDCPANIPHDNTLRVHGNYCYTFDTHHSLTFGDAEHQCAARRGHLVIVRNADTQNFLYTTLNTEFRYRGIIWIGFTDAKVEGQWEWVDGSPAHYTSWASGQPGFGGSFEDCAAMDMTTHGQWHDYQCEGLLFFTSEHRFVCEYPIPGAVITTAAPAVTTAAPAVTTAAPVDTTAAPVVDTTAAPVDTTTPSAQSEAHTTLEPVVTDPTPGL